MTADNLLSGTFYWGDPNIQAFQADYGHDRRADDHGGRVQLRMACKCPRRAVAHFPAKDAPNSLPTPLDGAPAGAG